MSASAHLASNNLCSCAIDIPIGVMVMYFFLLVFGSDTDLLIEESRSVFAFWHLIGLRRDRMVFVDGVHLLSICDGTPLLQHWLDEYFERIDGFSKQEDGV